MRVVIFWTMCHHSLGHEKKALLIVNTRLMNISRTTDFLIIIFISEMIEIHRDLKRIKIHLLTTKSSNNYEMFNMH